MKMKNFRDLYDKTLDLFVACNDCATAKYRNFTKVKPGQKESKNNQIKNMAKRKENTLEKKAKTATIAPGASNEETSDEKLAFAKIQFRKNWKEAKLDKYADVPEEDGDDEYIESCKNELECCY